MKIVHVFKVVQSHADGFKSATFYLNRESAIDYAIGKETRGFKVCGRETPIFAFTDLYAADRFRVSHGDTVFKCLAAPSAAKLSRDPYRGFRLPYGDLGLARKMSYWKTLWSKHTQSDEGNVLPENTMLCQWVIPYAKV